MKICICGGGNLAHAFVGELGNNKEVDEVYVLTRKPQHWNNEINVFYNATLNHIAKISQVTDDYNILKNMDIVVICVPGQVKNAYVKNLKNYINPETILMTAPSTGGINFIFEQYFPNNKFVCLQRVPYICRTIEYGKSVKIDVKKKIEAYFSKTCDKKDHTLLTNLLKMEIKELKSYIPLILSNSNPILHIAGMLEVLHKDYPCVNESFLYDVWSDYASNIAISMDKELKQIMDKLNISEFHDLYSYYEVNSVSELTKKLKSIESFKMVKSPLIQQNTSYVLDKNSRYITEDLPFGTCFIKYYAQKLDIKIPYTDKAIKKLQPFMDIEFIDENNSLDENKWLDYIGICYIEI